MENMVDGAFETVTVRAVEVARLPAVSLATATSVCEPFVAFAVFHVAEYGAVVSSGPIGLLSNLNWTPATPAVSEAAAETAIVPETAPAAGAVRETVGRVLSGTPETVIVFVHVAVCVPLVTVMT